MPSDRVEPWSGATYNGFSGAGTPEAPPRSAASVAPPARPHAFRLDDLSRNQKIMGGVAAALVLGLAFGLWARTGVHRDGRAGDPLSASAESAVSPRVNIELTKPAPMTLPRAVGGRMEVLPADLAASARASAPMAAPRARAAMDNGANIAVISRPVIDASPLSRAERRAMARGEPLPADPEFAPPPRDFRLSRAERRALRDVEPLRADPRYLPPEDEPVDDDEAQ